MRAVARGILLWFSNLGPTAVQDPWKPLQLVVMGGLALAAFLWYVVPDARLKDFAHESMLKQREAQEAVARTERAHAETAEIVKIADTARSEVSSLRNEYERLKLESMEVETKLSASIAEAGNLAKERDRLSAAVGRSNQVLNDLTVQRDLVSKQLNDARIRLAQLSYRTACFVTELFIAKVLDDGRWYSNDVIWANEPGYHLHGAPFNIRIVLPPVDVSSGNFEGGEGGEPDEHEDGLGAVGGDGDRDGGMESGGRRGGDIGGLGVTAWLAYRNLPIERDALGPLHDPNPTADAIIRRRLEMPELQLLARDERQRFNKIIQSFLGSTEHKDKLNATLRLAPMFLPESLVGHDGKLTEEGLIVANERSDVENKKHRENHEKFVNVVLDLYRILRLDRCDQPTPKSR